MDRRGPRHQAHHLSLATGVGPWLPVAAHRL